MQFTKNIISYLVTPLVLLTVIVVCTQILIVERQNMIHSSEVSDEYQRGIGIEQAYPLIINEWQPYYGGGQGIEQIIVVEDTSLRISTGGDGGWYGARAAITSDSSLANHSISLAVYADDWDSIDRLLVMFSTNDNYTDYFGINLKNYFSTPADGEWNEVVLEQSAFEKVEGAPLWSNISDVAVRVVPKPGVSTRVWFDEFQIIPDSATAPVISFTFDDGFKSVVEAADIMNEYNYEGSVFIIPRLLDTEDYMTKSDIDFLHNRGWDISGHSNIKLTDRAPSDLDTELASIFEYLDERDYVGKEHFAYPNGAYNQSVKSQVLEYFTSARTIDGFVQPAEYAYRQNINAYTISSTTPITEIVKVVNQAVKDNSWLILVWHEFNNNPVEDYEYNLDDFRWLTGYINESKIEVQPYSVVYDRLYR